MWGTRVAGADGTDHRFWGRLLVVAVVVAGCGAFGGSGPGAATLGTEQSSTSPAESFAATPPSPGVAGAVLTSPTPVATESSAPSTAPAPSASPASSPAVAAAPTATPLPSVPAAPSGAWRSLRWIAAGDVLPAALTTYGNAQVFGWSRGYVAFAFDAAFDSTTGPTHLLSASSRDGLHWSSVREAALPPNVATEPTPRSVGIASLQEGPAGLLAAGGQGNGTCGPPPSFDALWTSKDAVVWTPVRLPKTWLASIVNSLSGGSTGFIAGALYPYDNLQGRERLWTSRDGRTWHVAPVPTSRSGRVVIEDVADFAGGYVLVGAVIGPDGCGGPNLVQPSVWWSTTGGWWARIPIGPLRRSGGFAIRLTRVSDHLVVAAIDDETGANPVLWSSTDGRRWVRLPASRTMIPGCLITDRTRGLCVQNPANGSVQVSAVNPNLTLRPLAQSGTPPTSVDYGPTYSYTLGPTGILAMETGTGTLWLGVPSTK